MIGNSPVMVVEETSDPTERARTQEWRARADRNAAWFQAHAAEIYTRYRGQCVCVAGEELFVANAPEAALALAHTAHPEDDALFLRYIPRERVARIYADQR